MQNRIVMLMCNLKPAKMRGIESQAMVMCASTPNKVEILQPPPGAEPGDRVYVDGYEGTCILGYVSRISPMVSLFPFKIKDTLISCNTTLNHTPKGFTIYIKRADSIK